MKHIKHILCLLLAGSLLFATACGKEKKDDNSDFGTGRYIESDITPPVDGRFNSFLSADGSIVCFSEGLKTRYESSDGGASWNQSAGPGSNSDRYQSAQGATLLSDGSLLVYIQNEGLEIISPDGGARKIPVGDIDDAIAGGENISLSILQGLDNSFLISYMIGGFVQQQIRNGDRTSGNPSPDVGPQGPGADGNSGFVTRENPQGGNQGITQNSPQGGAMINPQGGGQDGAQTVAQGEPQDGAQVNPQGEARVNTGDEPSDGADSEPSGGQRTTDTYVSAPVPSGGSPSGGSPSGGGPSGGMSSAMSMRSRILLCDLSTGQTIFEISAENALSAVARGDNIYIMDMSGNVSIYNLSDGSRSSKPDIRLAGADSNAGPMGPGAFRGMGMRLGGGVGSVLAVSADGAIYAALDGSLMMADADGSISTALSSTAYSIGAPRNSVSSVFTLSDDSIIVNMLESGMSNRLYKYVWSDNATVDPEKTLTVWSLSDNYFMRGAIAELRKKHPDSLINYEITLDGNSAVSASDAIKTLNSRLLSGDAPDVLLLDGCAADSYASRGILLDINDLVDTGDIFPSLLSSYVNDGKLFYLPTQFYMPMLMGSADALAGVHSLDDLVGLVVNGNDLPASGGGGPRPFSGVDEEERSALYFSNLEELCETLWASCAPEVVKDNRLDTDALRRYLEAVKSISDKYAMTETQQGNRGMGMRAAFSDGGVPTVLPGSLMWYTMQLTNYAAFSAGNLQLLQMMMDRVGSTLELFPGLTPGAWQPSTVVGVSADAGNPQFAAELIGAMLSVDVQQLNYGTGLPVTAAGLDAQIKTINERRAENGEEPFSFVPNALIDKLSSPSIRDTVLTDMMWNGVEKCCKGEIDIEGAVREIEQNVKNYLAERE